jgi:hypothetical protein
MMTAHPHIIRESQLLPKDIKVVEEILVRKS